MSMLIFKSLFIVPQYMWLVAQWCPILRTHGPYRSRILCPQESPVKNAGVRSHSLHQGIVLNQGLNPHLPALQADFFYCLRHQGSPVYKMLRLGLGLFNFYAEYIMQNSGLDEAQAGIKIARRNIMQMTPLLWQKVKRN